MKLINISDLEKFICEHRCVIGDDHILLVAADDGRWHEALPLVKTAYDVDKVVAELEKAKTINVDVGFGTIYKAIRKDAAIEIVKAGGIDER